MVLNVVFFSALAWRYKYISHDDTPSPDLTVHYSITNSSHEEGEHLTQQAKVDIMANKSLEKDPSRL